MINNNRFKILAATLLATTTAASLAAPFNSFDPRSMGMGGVGVAVSNGNTAPLFNPALLAIENGKGSVHVTLPAIGGRAYDPDEFIDAVDDFQDGDYIDRLDLSISSAESNPTDPESYRDVADDTDSLNSGLQTLDNKEIQGELGGAVVVSVPGRELGYAFMANSWLVAGGVVNYEDGADLTALSADAELFAECLEDNLVTLGSCDPTTLGLTLVDPLTGDINYDPNNDVKSTVDVRGVVLAETGISLAHGFDLNGQAFTVGITPKYVTAMVFDYQANVDNADEDDFDADDYTEEYSDFNLDIGASYEFAPGWRAGLVVKNIISQEYETTRFDVPTGNVVELNPQVRAGVSWQADWYTLAADLDLTENDPAGLEDPSQYLAMGAELIGWEWVQLRLGYRADLSNSERSTASIGLGLSPGPVHFDVAFASNGDEMGAAAQFGFQF